MADIHDLGALEQAAAIRSGELSPVEVTEHYLDRIERLNDGLGAFVTVTPERALAQARAAADQLAGGDFRDSLPPLFGVPIAIKDLTSTAGVRTTFGSRVYAGNVPDTDAPSVVLLRQAGTISLGKTNTPEFGTCCYTDNEVTGPARSPFDPVCNAGGSSGGSAAAVAAALVPFAHGSDGGGSLRIPASVCGIVGLKPSRGRVSNGAAESTGLSIQGPLARSVADAAALLDALAVPVPGDPYWAPPLPPGETFLGYARREPGRLRIGRYATAANGTVPHPACRAAWEDVAALLAGLGHEVEEIHLPFPAGIADCFNTVWGVKALDTELSAAEEELLRPVTRAWRDYGRTKSGHEYATALTTMQLAARQSVEATAGYDIVLTPTLGLPPQPAEFFAEDGDVMDNLRRQGEFTPYTGVYNMTGQPAVSLPLHWTADGVPIGVSLIGRPAGEGPLLSLAAQLEAARPWAGHRPACW
ncbi:MAG: amidase [Streptosporangiaceae bacterium]